MFEIPSQLEISCDDLKNCLSSLQTILVYGDSDLLCIHLTQIILKHNLNCFFQLIRLFWSLSVYLSLCDSNNTGKYYCKACTCNIANGESLSNNLKELHAQRIHKELAFGGNYRRKEMAKICNGKLLVQERIERKCYLISPVLA